MDKLAMVSIIVATILAPALASRDRDGRRGLKRMVFFLFLFNAAYVAYVTVVHAGHHMPQRPVP